MNKTSGGDGIPVELFQILKDDAVKVLHSICQQIWKTQQWPQDHNKVWKILQETTCLLRNLCAGQEAIVRTGHARTDWFQIGKGVCQGCILSPSLFNLYTEYIMRNAGLEEAQAGVKITRRNISNLRYADDTTLMAKAKKN